MYIYISWWYDYTILYSLSITMNPTLSCIPSFLKKACISFPSPSILEDTLKYHQLSPAESTKDVLYIFQLQRVIAERQALEELNRKLVPRCFERWCWWFCPGIVMGNFTCKLGSFSEVWWNVMKYGKISFRLWNSQKLSKFSGNESCKNPIWQSLC